MSECRFVAVSLGSGGISEAASLVIENWPPKTPRPFSDLRPAGMDFRLRGGIQRFTWRPWRTLREQGIGVMGGGDWST